MDIEEELRKGNEQHIFLNVANHVGNDSSKFQILIDLFLGKDTRFAQIVSNPIAICIKRHPFILNPHLKIIIHQLKTAKIDIIRRNCVKFLQFSEIPEDYMGKVAELCFGFLADTKEAIAIKVFSMTVLYNISKKFPELQKELIFLIEEQLPYGSAGFKSRGNKILNQMSFDR